MPTFCHFSSEADFLHEMIPVVSHWIKLQFKTVSRVMNLAHSMRLGALLWFSTIPWFKQWEACRFWPQIASRDFQPTRGILADKYLAKGDSFALLHTGDVLVLGAHRRKLENLTLLFHWSRIQPGLVAQDISLTAVNVWTVPVLTQELVISSLMVPNLSHHIQSMHLAQCFWASAWNLVCFDLAVWVLPMKGFNSLCKPFLSVTLQSLLFQQHCLCLQLYTALWSDLCALANTETVLLAIFFLWFPCWGKLSRPLFVHQVKLCNVCGNEIDVSRTGSWRV